MGLKTLRIILGDQLSHNISSLSGINPENDIILMAEVWQEATYVKHHKKKIAFLFSAMRHFADELKARGFNVAYTKLDQADNTGSLKGEIERAIKCYDLHKIIATFPGEYRVLEDMKSWEESFDIPVEIRPDERFLCNIEDFRAWAGDRKNLRMEFFYRDMRKKYNILLKDGQPVGGQWNYDAENRKTPSFEVVVPPPFSQPEDSITQEVKALVEKRFSDHFGDLDPFYFAVTRTQALEALNAFIKHRLKHFGDYQDAMIQNEPWMFHSHLSFYINCGLLDPLECIKAAESAFYSGSAPLNAAEGFIRQILGWREYIRGIYWLKMPQYAHENFFEANRKLPSFYWDSKTDMNCLRQCVQETQKNAYAHHIQRLMVLGNFALLAGVDPKLVNEWFLVVYADAYEWVEMPNVSGMILFADGGLLASKPYAAGGAYINRMSNYCNSCRYKVSKKNGPQACPFNYLYWDFLIRHREKLGNNARLGLSYKTIDRMDPHKIEAIKDDAKRFFKGLTYYEEIL